MVPMIQIRDRSVIHYWQPDPSSYSEKRRDNMVAIRKKRYSGTMTQGARKRLTKALTLMAQAVKPRWVENKITGRLHHHHLSFITLTISCLKTVSSKKAYDELLAPFLQWLRDTKNVKAYVWKCEKQKRGQPHYHIVIPDFIYHQEIRRKWNSLQKKAGLLDEFAAKHGHYKPPSTEIKEKKSGQLQYLVKDIISEMAKTVDAWELKIREEMDQEIAEGKLKLSSIDFDYLYKLELAERMESKVTLEGKTWDCSLNLSRAKYYTIKATHEHFDRMELIAKTLIIKQDEWFGIITFTGEGPPFILNDIERVSMDIHFSQILNNNGWTQ